jgi:tRNA modification GTPase
VRAAVRTMQGEFSDRINELQARITELRMLVEAAIDFPDEELDFVPMSAVQAHLATVFAAFDSIAAAARQGALLRDGLNVVIAGRPNAGKSSLLNKLVGDEVAIVAASPGTTRDVLRQHLHLDGLPLNLIDTAGLRRTADAVEAEGVRRAKSELTRADRVLYILDGAASKDDAPDWAAELEQLPPRVPVTLLINKIDLIATPARIDETSLPPRIYLSAKTGAGLSLLRAHLKAAAGYVESGAGALSARRRHLDALRRARSAVEAAAENVAAMRGFELFAEDLRLAQLALSEITGEVTSDDLLGEIFSSFCIGK